MDNEDGDFEHLKINVNENEGNGNEINESEKCGKSKRKTKLQITEYMSKRKKIHAVWKERKQMQEDIKNAPEYQKQFQKFSTSEELTNENKENGDGKKLKRKKIQSKLSLNESRKKNARYVQYIIKSNPQRYAELFSKRKNSQ